MSHIQDLEQLPANVLLGTAFASLNEAIDTNNLASAANWLQVLAKLQTETPISAWGPLYSPAPATLEAAMKRRAESHNEALVTIEAMYKKALRENNVKAARYWLRAMAEHSEALETMTH